MSTALKTFPLASFALLAAIGTTQAAPSPRFHVFVAFGQSNMEGAVNNPEAQDKVVNQRFLELAAVTCNGSGRSLTQGTWTPAIAPIVRCDTKISVVDWFGRAMLDSLPATDTVGLVVVAVGGTKIEGFDLDKYQAYYASQPSWMQNYANNYAGNPYGRMVTIAKQAQQRGIVRGILLHQGESNAGDNTWASQVNKIYNKLLTDLGLTAQDAPLLAGQVAPGGSASGANTMINALPNTIPTAKVVSAQGLTTTTADGQNVHFNAESYRTLGKRYAAVMYPLIKSKISVSVQPKHTASLAANQGLVVYNLKGETVARFSAGTSAQEGWDRVRRDLPVGLYWLRSAASTVQVVNGR